MAHAYRRLRTLAAVCAIYCTLATAYGASKDLGNGFVDHGVAAPISNHRGAVATVDGSGKNVFLLWLMDHRGGYALLLIDATTGKAEQFPIPFANTKADSPYASILSSGNRFYTHFGDHFVEFDPVKRNFTFCSKTTPQMSMGMTEDDRGSIWSVAYPQSALVSFDPKSREFHDYGNVYTQNWPQYQRFVAADDAGFIYFALGQTASQIVAFDPATTKAVSLFSEAERVKGTAYLYRDTDGKVYGQAHRDDDSPWLEFYKGAMRKIGKHVPHPKPIITDSQALFHADFPDGTRMNDCDLVNRKIIVGDPRTSTVKELAFDYTSEGAIVMGVATSPNGLICGGTTFPMRFFSLDPTSDNLTNRTAHGQWNTVARQGDHFFAGGYPGGFLLEWNPAQPWVNTMPGNKSSNPQFLTKVSPVIHRPHSLLPLDSGTTVIMGGTPEYGYTGGGLLFWDHGTQTQTVLKDTDVIPDQSTMSMVPIDGNKILGGTTTSPGTGGEKKASRAELYLLDLATKKLDWHSPIIPGAQEYTALYVAPTGSIFGIADRKILFQFDAIKRAIISQRDIQTSFGLTVSQQGPRVFVQGDNKRVFVLLVNGVAELNTTTGELTRIATSPLPIECGGDYLNNRIYFACGSHLCSYGLRN